MRRYTERISVTLPVAEAAKLKAKAAELGISTSELLRRITERPTP